MKFFIILTQEMPYFGCHSNQNINVNEKTAMVSCFPHAQIHNMSKWLKSAKVDFFMKFWWFCPKHTCFLVAIATKNIQFQWQKKLFHASHNPRYNICENGRNRQKFIFFQFLTENSHAPEAISLSQAYAQDDFWSFGSMQ